MAIETGSPRPLQQSPSQSSSLANFLNSSNSTQQRSPVFFYSVVSLVLFSLLVVFWTFNAPHHKPLQCPDCNCGAESRQLPVSHEGAETILGVGLSVFTLQLVLCIFATYILVQNRFMYLPSCIAYVLMGILVGSIVRVSGSSKALGFSLPNQEQFFTFILPPIILEAGYSLNKRDFYAESLGILLLAVPGTLVSALAFGIGMYVFGILGISYFFSFWEAMTFGALLSAVDPVATIAIFSAMKVNKTLHFLVFGESVLNDAVAIVLYRTFSRLIGYSATTWYGPVLSFIYVFFGSAIIGAALAVITALLLKHSQLYRSPSLEFSFFLLMAYLPYPFCDGMGMSGILGILVSAVILAHYAHYNLSKITQISSQQAFRTLAFLAETFVFIYLGTALTTFNHSWHVATILIGIFFTLLSRAANIFPMTALLNRWRSDKISAKTKLIMLFSGSLRGAIAWALSLSLPSRNGSDDTRRVVISSTLAIVLFTIVVLGGGMLPLLRLLRIEEEAHCNDDAPHHPQHQHHAEEDGADSTSNAIANRLQRLDDKYLRPLLLAAPTRSMVATNRTLQTLAVSDAERLSPHELGTLLDATAAVDEPTLSDEEARCEVGD